MANKKQKPKTALKIVKKAKAKKAKAEKVQPLMIVQAKQSKEQITEAFDLLGITSKLPDERTKKLFVEVAHHFELDPLKREIHAVSIWDKDTGKEQLVPVTGYEVYIDRAEKSHRLEYWFAKEIGDVKDGSFAVEITIKRKDWPKEFVWVTRYSECVRTKKDGTPNVFWKTKPQFMTKKCAIAQAFRLCMREILQGIPYIQEEMEGAEIGKDQAPEIIEPRKIEEIDPKGDIEQKAKEADNVALTGEILAARKRLNEIFHEIGNCKKFTDEEILELVEKAKTAKDDVKELVRLHDVFHNALNTKLANDVF